MCKIVMVTLYILLGSTSIDFRGLKGPVCPYPPYSSLTKNQELLFNDGRQQSSHLNIRLFVYIIKNGHLRRHSVVASL